MARLQTLAITLAAIAVLVVIGLMLFSEQPPPESVFEVVSDENDEPLQRPEYAERPREGGVYAGVVQTMDGRPIHGARVLLVSYETGNPKMLTAGAGADPDPDVIADVPVIGSHNVGGEMITGKDGSWRVAADAQSLITRVLAYHQGYFLEVVEVKKPRDDIVLRLQEAGRVVGTVVDDKTGDPVPGAVVNVYLQQKVSKVPDTPGSYGLIKRKQHKKAWLATLGRFIGKTLGPRIWNVTDSQDETLRLRTDSNGRFQIGPLGNTVQLEFIVTHPKYAWTDFDSKDGAQTPARLVVEPGQTVDREFRLKRGLHVAGQIVDDKGVGVPDVFVKVQSISAYYRHWWYKHRWRRARTDKHGRFRVDGLAIGSQQVIFQHPSFEEITESVEAGTDELLVVAERFGALQGVIEGVTPSKARRRITVFFEVVGDAPTRERQSRRTVGLDASNSFLVKRVPPGTYRCWVKAGKESSQPIEVEIGALQIEKHVFQLGAGGTILARVVDGNGRVVDPASARLVALEGETRRAMGTFVTRQGEFELEGIAEGRYLLRVGAPGRIAIDTEPFDVGAARVANLGALTLEQFGYVRFALPVNARGRPVKLTEDLILEYRVGEGAWQRVHSAGIDMPVAPGRFEYRARSGAMSDSGTLDVKGGETLEATLVFPEAR